MVVVIIILLLLFGAGFLTVELFLLPGFGVAGVAGVASLGGAVYMAYDQLAPTYPWAGHVTLFLAVLLTGLSIYLFLRSKALKKMSLDTTIDSKVGLASSGNRMEQMTHSTQAEEKK